MVAKRKPLSGGAVLPASVTASGSSGWNAMAYPDDGWMSETEASLKAFGPLTCASQNPGPRIIVQGVWQSCSVWVFDTLPKKTTPARISSMSKIPSPYIHCPGPLNQLCQAPKKHSSTWKLQKAPCCVLRRKSGFPHATHLFFSRVFLLVSGQTYGICTKQ